MQPIVSITIPTYNRGYLLRKSLALLCQQIDNDNLHSQVEIVISDNCSTDNTADIVNEFIAKEKYQIVYNKNKQNLGVIKNILKLVELSSAKYWMFYGDDDIIPEGALKQIIAGFNANSDFSAFMYRWPVEADDYCKTLTADTELTFEALARDYFYYIGNAGIFAVETEKVKQIVKDHSPELIDTCWPQTLMIFVAISLSRDKKIKFLNIVSAIPPIDVIVVSNCYYLFETTIYALLRTALSIEKITKQSFVDTAIHSVYGIQHFEDMKEMMLERYCFYDLPKQKKDMEASVNEAVKTIPAKYRKEINYLHSYIARPNLFLYFKFYVKYIEETQFKKLDTGFLNKIKIMSPLGFNAIIKHRINEMDKVRQNSKKTEVDSNSGYF